MADGVFDVIVVGLGGMGSAAAAELARRGRRVLGLEQFTVGHDRGSSHGHTRIIRTAYYEHPDYVPLARRAFGRWHDLEQRQGVHLLTACPCLTIGRPDSEMVGGVLRSAAEHKLPVESLSPGELRRRYPAFRLGDEYVGVVEDSAGFLYVDECVRAHVRDAVAHGATVRDEEPVVSWEAAAGGVTVRTAKGSYAAARLVLTAGPWAPRLLARGGAPLTVMRQVPMWFGTADNRLFRRDAFPVFIAEVPEGHFYGLPVLDTNGLKVAQHYGAPELTDPAAVERAVSDADEAPVRAFLRKHIPAANGPRRRASVCIYTLSPDRHFVLDLHTEHPNIAVAAGFSGHGFKFAPVVGEILADFADSGRTGLPVSRFRIGRFNPG
jgi:sarcosine oxidase